MALTFLGDVALPYFDANGDGTVQEVKGSAGALHFLSVSNPNATAVFLQLFDATAPTVGTTTPKFSFLVPGSGATDKTWTIPVTFVNAIKYACTTTATGSTAPAVGLVVNAAYR